MTTPPSPRPPLPPFTRETAVQKVRLAEDAWNTRDPQRVALACTEATSLQSNAVIATDVAIIGARGVHAWEVRSGACAAAATANPH